jgi:hypothetical protein
MYKIPLDILSDRPWEALIFSSQSQNGGTNQWSTYKSTWLDKPEDWYQHLLWTHLSNMLPLRSVFFVPAYPCFDCVYITHTIENGKQYLHAHTHTHTHTHC